MEEKIRLFYEAAKHQTDVMIKNILGQGMDVHLLGLRQLARQSGCNDAIALFQDPSHQIIHHFALSTSQVLTMIAYSHKTKDKETKSIEVRRI